MAHHFCCFSAPMMYLTDNLFFDISSGFVYEVVAVKLNSPFLATGTMTHNHRGRGLYMKKKGGGKEEKKIHCLLTVIMLKLRRPG